jgi:hypothetical protein
LIIDEKQPQADQKYSDSANNELTVSDASVTESRVHCQHVVNQIRSGLLLTKDGEVVVGVLGRALERLSKELYRYP